MKSRNKTPRISPELIESFCSDEKKYLSTPYNIGDYTYATDGLVAIRVARNKKYDKETGPKSIEKILPSKIIDECNIWTDRYSVGDSIPIPCTDCHGKGIIIALSNSGIRYEIECKLCHGKKEKHTALKMKSVRAKDSDETTELLCFGNILIAPKLFSRVAKLPKLEISTDNQNEIWKPMCFRFDGGIGIICKTNVEAINGQCC
jgi:hypothetical protein